MDPLSADKLRTYATTVLEFEGSNSARIDLRQRVGEADLRLLASHRLVPPFAVLTAYNPHGDVSPQLEADNARMQATMEYELQESGFRGVRVDGCSPDRTHCEASVAVRMTEEKAREWAIRYEQDAFFWFDGTRFWIVGALEPFGRVSLPLDEGSNADATVPRVQ